MNMKEACEIVSTSIPGFMDFLEDQESMVYALTDHYSDWACDSIDSDSPYEYHEVMEAYEIVASQAFNAVVNARKPKKSLIALRAEREEQDKRRKEQEERNRVAKLCKLVSESLTDAEFCEKLEFNLIYAGGYVGIKASGIDRYQETVLDDEEAMWAIAEWESRDVRFRFCEKGLLLYVAGIEPKECYTTWLDFHSPYRNKD